MFGHHNLWPKKLFLGRAPSVQDQDDVVLMPIGTAHQANYAAAGWETMLSVTAWTRFEAGTSKMPRRAYAAASNAVQRSSRAASDLDWQATHCRAQGMMSSRLRAIGSSHCSHSP